MGDVSQQRIDIAALREIVDKILAKMLRDGITHVDLGSFDFYWSMDDDQLYHLPEPQEPTIGSLRDDWEFLLPMLKDDDRAFPLMFIHVAPLLMFLAYHSSPQEQ